MLSLALYPLAIYFLVLAVFHARRRPTVLSGWADFMLLAFGISGLLTLSLGRLLLPLNLMEFWGLGVWLHWGFLYFLVASYLGWWLPPRLIVYHCPIDRLWTPLQNRVPEIDPLGRWDRSLLSLPTLDCQAMLTGDVFGGHLRLQAVMPGRRRAGWQRVEREMRDLCDRIDVPFGKGALYWGALAGVVFVTATVWLVLDFPKLYAAFTDCWL